MLFYDSEGIITWKGFPYKDAMTKMLVITRFFTFYHYANVLSIFLFSRMRQIQRVGLKKLKKKNIILPYINPDSLNPLSFDYVWPIFAFYVCLIILSVIICILEVGNKNKKLKVPSKLLC